MLLLGHAKWFVDDPAGFQAAWGFLFDARTLLPLAGAVATSAAAWSSSRRRGRASVPAGPPGALVAVLPRLVAASLGVTLPILAVQERLLLPDVSLHGVPGAFALRCAEVLVGLWLMSGVRLGRAAAALGGLCVALTSVAGPLALLEGLYIPGIAIYLALAGRPTTARRALALTLGASLVVVAFTEKLLVPDVAIAVLDAHPSLDPLAAAGVHLPETEFVRLAGSVEVLLGLLIASGAARRLVALAALGPFLATVAVLGLPELIGHLPIYGTLVSLAATPPPRSARARSSNRSSPRQTHGRPSPESASA